MRRLVEKELSISIGEAGIAAHPIGLFGNALNTSRSVHQVRCHFPGSRMFAIAESW
jgi:hypothetical protein